jgi:hypothetical protein
MPNVATQETACGQDLDPSRRNNACVAVCGNCASKFACNHNPSALEDDGKPCCHVAPRPALTGSAARRTFGDSRF